MSNMRSKKSKDLKIVAHHKDSYNWAIDRRTEVDNGVTLCECCHIEFHKIYGFGDNTEEQYYEFLNMKRKYILNKIK